MNKVTRGAYVTQVLALAVASVLYSSDHRLSALVVLLVFTSCWGAWLAVSSLRATRAAAGTVAPEGAVGNAPLDVTDGLGLCQCGLDVTMNVRKTLREIERVFLDDRTFQSPPGFVGPVEPPDTLRRKACMALFSNIEGYNAPEHAWEIAPLGQIGLNDQPGRIPAPLSEADFDGSRTDVTIIAGPNPIIHPVYLKRGEPARARHISEGGAHEPVWVSTDRLVRVYEDPDGWTYSVTELGVTPVLKVLPGGHVWEVRKRWAPGSSLRVTCPVWIPEGVDAGSSMQFRFMVGVLCTGRTLWLNGSKEIALVPVYPDP